MGFKSRDNFKPGLCTRFDCLVRNIRCDTCFAFSNYTQYKSKCCNVKVRIEGGTTHYYVCTKCKKACDIK